MTVSSYVNCEQSTEAGQDQQELLPVPKPTLKPRRLIVGYGSTDTPGVDVPYLRLRGRWLQDAGFVIGRHVRIELSEGRMTIEADAVQAD